jgi:Fic family protein
LLWADLGAIQSKIEHVAHVLLAPKVAKELQTLYLAKGVHGTTAIEGNSLTEGEVRDRIASKMELPASQEYLGKAIDNIVAACNAIGSRVLRGGHAELTPEQVCEFNQLVLAELPVDEHVVPGKTRTCSVGVGRYKAPPWRDCRPLLDRLCQFLNHEFEPPVRELTTAFAVLQAMVAHLYIAWIHPFGDGNGRTARLVEFQLLLAGGVPTVAAHLLSNFYNLTRDKYYQVLSATTQRGGDVSVFLRYAVEGLRDQLDAQIKHIRQFQWSVVWRDYVHEAFRGQSGDASQRRRLLALELPNACDGVGVGALRRLTPEIAELYAGKTHKTLTRDLNELEKMELVVRTGQTVQANTAILAQFLPSRRTSHNPPGQGDSPQSGAGHAE